MTKSSTADLIQQEANLIATGIRLQEQGLTVLLTEMRALATLMPGNTARHPDQAEIEASFDNMPV